MPGMKHSTIKKVLRHRIDELLDSIEEDGKYKNQDVSKLIDLLKENTLVCGGSIASMLTGERPNDFDIYFKNYSTVLAVASYYANRFNIDNDRSHLHSTVTVRKGKVINIANEEEDRIHFFIKSAGMAAEHKDESEYRFFEFVDIDSLTSSYIEAMIRPDAEDEPDDFIPNEPDDNIKSGLNVTKEIRNRNKPKYRPIFFTDNAVSLANKIQIIVRFYGTPDQIHKNFDFAHCMCSYDYQTDTLDVSSDAMEALLSQSLIYRGSLYPIASLFRIRKFLNRGYRITAGQMLKIIWQVNELDLSNKMTLMEQLMGVDIAYMYQLIEHLKNVKAGTKIDSIYIAKVIDEIFE